MKLRLFKNRKMRFTVFVANIVTATVVSMPVNATELTTPDCRTNSKAPVCRYSREYVVENQRKLIRRNAAEVNKFIHRLPAMDWLFHDEKDWDKIQNKYAFHWPEREQRSYCETIKQSLLAARVDLFPKPDFESVKSTISDSRQELLRTAYKWVPLDEASPFDFLGAKENNFSFISYHLLDKYLLVYFSPESRETWIDFSDYEVEHSSPQTGITDRSDSLNFVGRKGIAVARINGKIFLVEVGKYKYHYDDLLNDPYFALWQKLSDIQIGKVDLFVASEFDKRVSSMMKREQKIELKVFNVFPIENAENTLYDTNNGYALIPCTWYSL